MINPVNEQSLRDSQNTLVQGTGNTIHVKNVVVQKGRAIEGYSVQPESFIDKIVIHFLHKFLGDANLITVYCFLAVPNLALISGNVAYYALVSPSLPSWLVITALLFLVFSIWFYRLSEERHCNTCKKNFSRIAEHAFVIARKRTRDGEEQLRLKKYVCSDCGANNERHIRVEI